MLNALTNTRNFAFLLFIIANANSGLLDSIPIAEYCVGYGNKTFCDICYTCDDDCNKVCDSTNVHLHLKTNIQKLPRLTTCVTYSDSIFGTFSSWISKFLMHDDLKIEKTSVAWDEIWSSKGGDSKGERKYPYVSGVVLSFIKEVPVYAKNGKQIDFNKYYEKNKLVPVEWEFKASCGSFYNVVYSGSYFIRITGECDAQPAN